jgi:hypothetical protein
MSVEQKQLKNLRNRAFDYIKKSTPETLVKLALFLKIKVPNELIEKYKK